MNTVKCHIVSNVTSLVLQICKASYHLTFLMVAVTFVIYIWNNNSLQCLNTINLFFQLLHITWAEGINRGKFGYGSSAHSFPTGNFFKSWSTSVDPTWRVFCYSSSESFNHISPETLWEVCHWIAQLNFFARFWYIIQFC